MQAREKEKESRNAFNERTCGKFCLIDNYRRHNSVGVDREMYEFSRVQIDVATGCPISMPIDFATSH
jgi:hypothetical protein